MLGSHGFLLCGFLPGNLSFSGSWLCKAMRLFTRWSTRLMVGRLPQTRIYRQVKFSERFQGNGADL